MNRDQTTETLRRIGEARKAWRQANLTVNSDIFTLMQRMLHEAAVNRLSIEDVANLTGFTIKRVREMMRNIGMDPRASRTLLAKRSATVLAENATLLGVEPSEFDLMSPLAYLPMGKDMKREIEAKTVSSVTEVSGNLEDRLYQAIVSEFEGMGEAWTTDESGDTLARAAAVVAAREMRA